MEVELLRYEDVEGSTFEKNKGEEEHLIQMVMDQKDHFTIEELTKLCNEIVTMFAGENTKQPIGDSP
jgi:hypothetical protein